MEEKHYEITGKYEVNDNFTYIYTKNAVYVIPHNANTCACIKVGERTATGAILTQEWLNNQKNECVNEGTFEI